MTIVCRHTLDGLDGALMGSRIWLDRRLGQAGRRSTLAHELVHLDRGMPVGDARARTREEAAVEATAARRLVSLAQLSDALRWVRTGSVSELADELWVDETVIRARLNGLTAAERDVLGRVIGEYGG